MAATKTKTTKTTKAFTVEVDRWNGEFTIEAGDALDEHQRILLEDVVEALRDLDIHGPGDACLDEAESSGDYHRVDECVGEDTIHKAESETELLRDTVQKWHAQYHDTYSYELCSEHICREARP